MFRHQLTPDLWLEPLDRYHAGPLFECVNANRQHLREWLSWVDYTQCVADTEGFIERSMKQNLEHKGFQATIWFQGQLIGMIGHVNINHQQQSTEIGYWLAEGFQGQGIMTQACRAMVANAFDQMGLNRVEIRCATENTKSRAIPERLGFTLEGIQRQGILLYDRFWDAAIYSRIKSDGPFGT